MNARVSAALDAYDAMVRYHRAVIAALPCGDCKAPAGQPCRSLGAGLVLRMPHKTRRDAYDAAQAEGAAT